MAQIEQSMAFEWPAAHVWAYLIAFEQVPLWEHGVVEVRRLAPGAPVVGMPILARRIFAGRETLLDGTIVSLDPGRQATLELRGGPIAMARACYAVDPAGPERCVVTYTGDTELRGPLRVFTPILPALGRREINKNLRRLQRRIAAGIPPTSAEPTPDEA
jgi:hypothetical protein